MANELIARGPTGGLYALAWASGGHIVIAGSGATEVYNASHYATYAITMTEHAGTGVYVGDMPASSADTYHLDYRQTFAGLTPAPSDTPVVDSFGKTSVQWTGTAETGGITEGDISAIVEGLFTAEVDASGVTLTLQQALLVLAMLTSGQFDVLENADLAVKTRTVMVKNLGGQQIAQFVTHYSDTALRHPLHRDTPVFSNLP